MNIVHILDRFDFCDGCARSVYVLAREQHRRGHRVAIAASGGDAVKLLDPLRIPFFQISEVAHETRSTTRFFAGAWKLRRYGVSARPDITHAHHYYAGNQARLGFRGLPSAQIFTAHALIPKLGRLSLYPGERIIGVSRAIVEDAVESFQIPRSHVSLVHNGIDRLPQQNGAAPISISGNPKHLVLSFAGRLVEEKGVFDLLRAVGMIEQRFPVRVCIAGSGPAEDGLKKISATLRSPVSFLGVLEGVEGLLKATDILVQPSLRWEGMPMILCEAGLAQTAVVSTTLAGIQELIVHEKTGLLGTPGNIDHLTANLVRLLESPPLRKNMARALHAKIVEEMGVDAMADGVQEVYESALRANR